MKRNIFTKFISLLTVFAMMFNVAIAQTVTDETPEQEGGFCSVGTLIEREIVTVFSSGVVSTSDEYPEGDYLLEANGTYEYRGSTGLLADAAFSERLPGDLVGLGLDPANYANDPWYQSNSYNSIAEVMGGLGIWVNGNGPVWGDTFNPSHQYFYEVEGFMGGQFSFEITDNNTNDNVGDLTVTIWECVYPQEPEPETPNFCPAGTTLRLLETIEVLPNAEIFYSSEYASGNYLLEASGTYIYRNYKGQGNEFYSADALYENLAPTDPGYGTNGNGYYTADGETWKISGASMGIRVNNQNPRQAWGTTFNPAHEYFYEVEDFPGGMFNFQITDSYYEDNEEFLTVKISDCVEEEELVDPEYCVAKTLRETVTVNPNGTIYSSETYLGGDYLLEANGTYKYRGGTNLVADAAFSERLESDNLNPDNYFEDTLWYQSKTSGHLGIKVNGVLPNIAWGEVWNSDHQYFHEAPGFPGGKFEFEITDDQYADNTGYLTVKIWDCNDEETTGIGDDGIGEGDNQGDDGVDEGGQQNNDDGQVSQNNSSQNRGGSLVSIPQAFIGEVLGATDGEVLGACVPFAMYHKKGDKGGEVAKIQEFLNEYMNAGLKVDGVYGNNTTKAVHTFQQKYFEHIIKPWVPPFAARTTGKWLNTTRMMANEIIDCPEEPVFLPEPGIMYKVKWEKSVVN